MRRFYFLAALTALAGAACGHDEQLAQTQVYWMDWPADVVAQAPFRTHLVVFWPCGARAFRSGSTVDQSAVTFQPYFDTRDTDICPVSGGIQELDVWGALDTAGTVAGLPANEPRTYEMRATAAVYAPVALASDAAPIRTFGDIAVQVSDVVLTTRRNAAGRARSIRDETGCLRLLPAGMFPDRALPLENPDDTTNVQYRFVRGYIYDAPSPTCGETRVFHLVSAN